MSAHLREQWASLVARKVPIETIEPGDRVLYHGQWREVLRNNRMYAFEWDPSLEGEETGTEFMHFLEVRGDAPPGEVGARYLTQHVPRGWPIEVER